MNATKNLAQFHHFVELPDHLIIKVMSECRNFRAVLNLAESSSHLHHLLITTPRLMKRLKLVMKFTRSQNDVVDKLSTLLSNASKGRRYSTMKLLYVNEGINSYVKPVMLKILKIIGVSVRELEIHSGTCKASDLVLVLQCFENVEKLTLNNLQEEASDFDETEAVGMLPHLKRLQLQDTKSTFLKLFTSFTKLQHFKFHLSSRESELLSFGIENFEDFLLLQTELKSLDIGKMHKNFLFRVNRLDAVKFRLESLIAVRFFLSRQNAARFFRQQTNLKSIKLYDFYESRIMPDRHDYTGVLRAVLSLPKLESLGIFNNSINLEDAEFLDDVRNNSITRLEYDMWNAAAIERFVVIFPKLESISFRCFTVKLKDVAHEKLTIMNTSGGYKLEEFWYQPHITTANQRTFEGMLRNFLLRHQTLKHFTIGSAQWLEVNFGLSLDFWIEILFYLRDLCDLIIYNPLNITQLVMLLVRNRNDFKSVILYTNYDGKMSTKGMEQPWLKVCVTGVTSPVKNAPLN